MADTLRVECKDCRDGTCRPDCLVRFFTDRPGEVVRLVQRPEAIPTDGPGVRAGIPDDVDAALATLAAAGLDIEVLAITPNEIVTDKFMTDNGSGVRAS